MWTPDHISHPWIYEICARGYIPRVAKSLPAAPSAPLVPRVPQLLSSLLQPLTSWKGFWISIHLPGSLPRMPSSIHSSQDVPIAALYDWNPLRVVMHKSIAYKATTDHGWLVQNRKCRCDEFNRHLVQNQQWHNLLKMLQGWHWKESLHRNLILVSLVIAVVICLKSASGECGTKAFICGIHRDSMFKILSHYCDVCHSLMYF